MSQRAWLLVALIAAVSKAAPVNEGVHVRREVIVKSKPHRVSHIDHFNPAGHVYAAQGEVDISRNKVAAGSSSTGGSKRQKIYSVPVKTFTSETISLNPQFSSVKSSSSFEPSLNLQKTVSIRQPSNVISSISHFNPAGHQYAATGSAQIRRQPSKQQQISRVPRPKTSQSLIVPGLHVSKQSSKFSSVPSGSKQFSTSSGGSSLNLERTVSVKSPQRISSVIDHFNPAGHQYAATGNVKINRQQIVKQSPKIVVSKKSQSFSAPQVKKFTLVKKAQSIRVPSQSIKSKTYTSSGQRLSSDKRGSGFNLEKTVSVKSPQRISTVINHFTPAGHQYAATGSVKINRESFIQQQAPQIQVIKQVKNIKKQIVPKVKVVKQTQTFVVPTVPEVEDVSTFIKQVVPRPQQSFISHSESSPSFSNNVGTGINLEKTVSVKSPQRISSVINHFTPAGHVYAATGNVKINRLSAAKQQPTKVTVSQKAQSFSVPKVAVKKKTNNLSFSVPQVSIDKFISPSSGSSSFVSKFDGSSSLSNKGTGSKVSIEKFVSVKSPQRVSSVISHFTPAQHEYAATGNVKINRQSFPKQESQRVNIIKEQNYVSPPKKQIVKIVKESETFRVPSKQKTFRPITKTSSVSSGLKSFSSGSGLSLDRTVSVKSPQRVSSVISHFTPAGHQYAATGNVKINRISNIQQQLPSVSVSKQTQSFVVPQFSSIVSKKVDKVSAQKKKETSFAFISKPSSSSTGFTSSKVVKESETFRVPSKQKTFRPITKTSSVSSGLKSFSSGSGLSLDRTVSVKSPQRVSSVISHFTPAGHQYAATGNVKINRISNIQQQLPSVSVSKQTQSFVVPQFSSIVSKEVDKVSAPKKKETSFAFISKPSSSSAGFTSSKVKGSSISIEKTVAPQKQIFVAPKVQKVFVPKPEISSGISESSFVSKKKIGSGFSLDKTVSVNSPKVVSTVIDHFTPAVHQYSATGSVKIFREPSVKQPLISSVQKPSFSQKNQLGGFTKSQSGTSSVVSSSNQLVKEIPVVELTNYDEEEQIEETENDEEANLKDDEHDGAGNEGSSVYIKVPSNEQSKEEEEEDEEDDDEDDDSDSDSDESSYEFGGSQFFGDFKGNQYEYLPPTNGFSYLPPTNGFSYLPPNNDYLPPNLSYATNDLPPIS